MNFESTNCESNQKSVRHVKDSIHNQISLRPFCWNVIDTLQFQRLREIKQLGPAYYVYSGAIHTRFEHSLGVGYMAQTMLEHFQATQGKDLGGLEESEMNIVVMAGLCNDLGQGVMFHLFDRQLIPSLAPSLKWDYKDASQMMLQYLVDEN
jgi:HD superfamily phosphohydrolase